MASSNLFHYLMIISIASSISSKSGRLQQPSPEKFLYDMYGINNFNDKEISRNDYYHYGRPLNPEPEPEPEPERFPTIFVEPQDRNSEETENRLEDRLARHLGDNNIICAIEITKGVFAQEGYDYFPSEYINKTCLSSKADPFKIESNGRRKPEVCLHNDNDFGCQTLYEELNVLRRKSNGKHECWEHLIQPVAVGCKCNIRFTY